MGLRPAKLHEKLPLRRRCPPGTDETAMDFRRLLPEIRWQSRLSPVCGTGSPDWFFTLSFRAQLGPLRLSLRLCVSAGNRQPPWFRFRRVREGLGRLALMEPPPFGPENPFPPKPGNDPR